MRRLLLLITDLEIGGTPTVVRELALRLREPGRVHVEVACLKGWGPVAAQLQRAGVEVRAFGATAAIDLPALVEELRDHVRDRQFDTILSFLVHANAAAASAAAVEGSSIRLFQSIQTTQPRPRWHWVLQAAVQARAERIIVPSPSVAQAAIDWSDVPKEKIIVVPNAVESPTGDAPARAQDGIFRVGFVGRLDPIKRLPDLILAMSDLGPSFSLGIIGEGPDRGRIEKLIRREKLGQRVTLRGVQAAGIVESMRAFDAIVLQSDAEGFGLVLIEAMAAGVPVVATDVQGIRDVVRDGDNGLLVPPRDPASIARALRALQRDAALRETLVANGRREAAERYAWSAILPKYREALGIA